MDFCGICNAVGFDDLQPGPLYCFLHKKDRNLVESDFNGNSEIDFGGVFRNHYFETVGIKDFREGSE
ncbi:hypothetical protein SDC9_130762 [bioreactor metagenome]|uniref:Uncharacterized protein n=1 Tax=bioreactor metagenome TaxID=1076179 RepID=A0A645D3K8_9ZZZZ